MRASCLLAPRRTSEFLGHLRAPLKHSGLLLAWADDAPPHQWVTAYDDRAIRFYERHGFTLTGEREPVARQAAQRPDDRDPLSHPGIV
ncbi:hypothetical protein ACWGDE_06540 [Streptomyces sp. NPDC054956]